MRRKVLVTDGEQRAALATVRSLGRAGYEVQVCSARAHPIAGASRHCAGSHNVADPLYEPRAFLSDVARLAANTKADVLLPVSEAALLAVLPYRDQFACVIPFADADSFWRVCDKREVLEAASKHGLAVPAQAEVRTPNEYLQFIDQLHFPLVLKPARSVAGREDQRIRAGVTYAGNAKELRAALGAIPPAAYPVLLQQRISGPGFGVSVLVWNGELVAAFAHRRIREKPPSGGVSVLRESIPLDRDLLSRSLALLRGINWQGVAMVEFKQDVETGLSYVMEINGRLWGSLQLAIDAGVDFPHLLVSAALGQKPAPVISYTLGVRLRWEWGDIDHLLASLRHHSLPATSQAAQRSRPIALLKQFVGDFSSGARSEVFRTDDPRPFLRETVDWFRAVARGK